MIKSTITRPLHVVAAFILTFVLSSLAYAESVEQAKKLISEQSINQGMTILLDLSDKGNADAKYELGKIYQDGLPSIQPNMQVANQLFKEAVDLSKHPLASMYLGINNILGRGTLQDFAEGKLLLGNAAKTEAEAMFILGNLVSQGIGYQQNQKAAFDWYLKSANKDFIPAMMETYRGHRNGVGTKVDNKKAYGWIKKLVDKKYPPSYVEMADMYQEGLGIGKDLVKAHVYYNLASYYGSPDANQKLNQLTKSMTYEQILQAQKQAKQITKE